MSTSSSSDDGNAPQHDPIEDNIIQVLVIARYSTGENLSTRRGNVQLQAQRHVASAVLVLDALEHPKMPGLINFDFMLLNGQGLRVPIDEWRGEALFKLNALKNGHYTHSVIRGSSGLSGDLQNLATELENTNLEIISFVPPRDVKPTTASLWARAVHEMVDEDFAVHQNNRSVVQCVDADEIQWSDAALGSLQRRRKFHRRLRQRSNGEAVDSDEDDDEWDNSEYGDLDEADELQTSDNEPINGERNYDESEAGTSEETDELASEREDVRPPSKRRKVGA